MKAKALEEPEIMESEASRKLDSEMSEKVVYYDPNAPESDLEKDNHNHREHEPRARIYCGGVCMTGPPSKSWPPIGILLLNLYHLAFNIVVFLFLLTNGYPRLTIAFGLTSFVGLWGVVLFVMSWFSDPGVIT